MNESFSDYQKFVVAASPPAWKDYAEELHDSAILLMSLRNEKRIISSSEFGNILDKSHVSRTFILLAGLSIENILKAIVIALEPNLVENGRLAKKIKHHKLLNLVSLIDEIILSDEEIEFCHIAQEAIPYWGRYPTPVNAEQLTLEKVATEAFLSTYQHLFSRLNEYLYSLIRNGWEGPHNMILREHIDSNMETHGT